MSEFMWIGNNSHVYIGLHRWFVSLASCSSMICVSGGGVVCSLGLA